MHEFIDMAFFTSFHGHTINTGALKMSTSELVHWFIVRKSSAFVNEKTYIIPYKTLKSGVRVQQGQVYFNLVW